MATAAFKIRGMDCTEEVTTLRKELGPLPSVSALDLDVLNARMVATFDERVVSTDELISAVARTGMTALPWQERRDDERGTWWDRWQRTLMTATRAIRAIHGRVL